jgi:hypothetical protein
MKIDGHYDQNADIAWLRFEGYDSATVVAEETPFGLRELNPADRRTRWARVLARERDAPA